MHHPRSRQHPYACLLDEVLRTFSRAAKGPGDAVEPGEVIAQPSRIENASHREPGMVRRAAARRIGGDPDIRP
jgi:hypothetical protein